LASWTILPLAPTSLAAFSAIDCTEIGARGCHVPALRLARVV